MRLYKAQSAIEYLMTYGWMLLVVAVVGGTIFSVVQNEGIDSVSGFSGNDVAVENFGLSQNNTLDMVLRNTAGDSVDVHTVSLSQDGEEVVTEVDKELAVGDSTSISTLGVVERDGTNSVNVEVEYDSGSLIDLSTTGSVSGSLDLNAEQAAPNENWAFVDVSEVNQSTVDTSDMGDFYVMKYEASRSDASASSGGSSSVPASQQGVRPWRYVTQKEAKNVCSDSGFGLPSNRQWQASTKAEIGNASSQPLGNNDAGCSIEDGSCGTSFGSDNITLTGSGPESWSNEIGVYDLNGNLWEWTSTNIRDSQNLPDTSGHEGVEAWNDNGYPSSVGNRNQEFGNDTYWSGSTGEAFMRGGRVNSRENAGVFSFFLDHGSSHGTWGIGFRCIKDS